jgi:flagellar basal body-associated protein FliL
LDKIVAILLIAILSIVSVASLSYYVLSQPNQTQSNPSPTPTSATTPTPSPSETPAASASIAEPSVPEFTVELVDTSYDVPTTYSTDPYTGDTVTHAGYHVARRTIEIRIKNPPFTPFVSDGREIEFYYNIRIKGHYEEWGSEFGEVYNFGEMPTRSNSEYTVISYNSEGTYSFNLAPVYRMLEVSADGEVDFQVKALIGYRYEAVTAPGFHGWFFDGKESGWSSTRTLTIP